MLRPLLRLLLRAFLYDVQGKKPSGDAVGSLPLGQSMAASHRRLQVVQPPHQVLCHKLDDGSRWISLLLGLLHGVRHVVLPCI